MLHPLIISVSMMLRNLLNEASVVVMLNILFSLLFLLILPLVSLHVILPVLLPLLGLVHHLLPLALQLFCRELPTLVRNQNYCLAVVRLCQPVTLHFTSMSVQTQMS